MMLRRIVFMAIFESLVLIAFAVISDIGAAADARIAVFVSEDQTPYEEALSGFYQYLGGKGLEADSNVYHLQGSTDKAILAVHEAEKENVPLIFALGSFATAKAADAVSDIPIISCMALHQDLLVRSANTTGVTLEFPVRIQFEQLQRLLPGTRTVGVIYNPAENEERVRIASKTARSMGLRLAAYTVNSPQELPSALDALSNRADVLWGLADSIVLTPQTARNILLFSLRNRIPFIGLSPAWTKAGAFYSLDWDYRDMGKQCGEMALRVLKGEPVRSIRPVPPRKVLYCINHKTAEHMKVDIPDDLMNGAHKVY